MSIAGNKLHFRCFKCTFLIFFLFISLKLHKFAKQNYNLYV